MDCKGSEYTWEFKMVPLLFVFCICYLAFTCNAVCDIETSIISFLTCFDFELFGQGSSLQPYCPDSRHVSPWLRQHITPILPRFQTCFSLAEAAHYTHIAQIPDMFLLGRGSSLHPYCPDMFLLGRGSSLQPYCPGSRHVSPLAEAAHNTHIAQIPDMFLLGRGSSLHSYCPDSRHVSPWLRQLITPILPRFQTCFSLAEAAHNTHIAQIPECFSLAEAAHYSHIAQIPDMCLLGRGSSLQPYCPDSRYVSPWPRQLITLILPRFLLGRGSSLHPYCPDMFLLGWGSSLHPYCLGSRHVSPLAEAAHNTHIAQIPDMFLLGRGSSLHPYCPDSRHVSPWLRQLITPILPRFQTCFSLAEAAHNTHIAQIPECFSLAEAAHYSHIAQIPDIFLLGRVRS